MDTDEGKNLHKQLFRKYLEGLQWVMHYYYKGVQSWRWFYPYHYPPMISDFEKIKDYLDYDIDSTFCIKDEPFLPFLAHRCCSNFYGSSKYKVYPNPVNQ